jgi:hypothetical protein
VAQIVDTCGKQEQRYTRDSNQDAVNAPPKKIDKGGRGDNFSMRYFGWLWAGL